MILEILRHTIVPIVEWDDNALEWLSMEIVNVVLSGEPINLLDRMVNQMMECKRNVDVLAVLNDQIRSPINIQNKRNKQTFDTCLYY